MPGQRVPPEADRNVHFVNADNDEIGGTWQNGSLTWAEMSELMQIVFELPLDEYAPFPCLEDGDPKDPVARHDAPIDMRANTNHIKVGFYVLLNPQGLPIEIPINPENPVPRAETRSLSRPDPRNEDFRNRVRARDGRCVMTGLEAAHIDLWRSGSWQKQITDNEYIGETGLIQYKTEFF